MNMNHTLCGGRPQGYYHLQSKKVFGKLIFIVYSSSKRMTLVSQNILVSIIIWVVSCLFLESNKDAQKTLFLLRYDRYQHPVNSCRGYQIFAELGQLYVHGFSFGLLSIVIVLIEEANKITLKVYLQASLSYFLIHWLHQDDMSLFKDMCIIKISPKKLPSLYIFFKCYLCDYSQGIVTLSSSYSYFEHYLY